MTVLRLPLDPPPVLLGTATDTGDHVELRFQDRTLGVSLVGKRGTGKSSLLEHLILADLDNGTPGMVIDPHGVLAHRVIGLASPEQAEHIVLLEALTSKPFGLNLLALRDPVDEDDDPVSWAADSVVETVKKLYGQQDQYLPRLEQYLDLAVQTLIPNHGTLAEVPRLFRNPDFRTQSLRKITDSDILDQWRQFESLRTTDQISYIEVVINRLSRMLRHPLIKAIVGASRTTVPLDDVLNGNTMLIVSLPSERLGRERCNFIGALLLCAFADKIFLRRTMDKKPRVHLYLDEYQRFATITIAELLEEGRKYGAGVTMAHQSLFQIKDDRIRNASRHAGTLVAFPVTYPDADMLAGEFPIVPRPEWTEIVEEQDGFERELILSPNPVVDIQIKGHSNSAVHEAVVMMFLEADDLNTYLPHPARDRRDVRFCAASGSRPFLDLLLAAMEHGSPSRRELIEFIWNYNFPNDLLENDLGEIHSFHLADGCMEWAVKETGSESANHRIPYICMDRPPPPPPAHQLGWSGYSPSLIGYRYFDPRDPHVTGYSSDKTVDYHYGAYNNQQLRRLQKKEVSEFVSHLRAWFDIQVSCLDELLNEAVPDIAREADEHLVEYAVTHRWAGNVSILLWHGQDFPPSWSEDLRQHFRRPPQKIREDIAAAPAYMREELVYWYRWLSILCAGLAEEPVRIETANMRLRMRTRTVLHGGQTVQDAVNEFVLRLVTHPAPFMAHIKQSQEYHHTKLVAQIAATVSDDTVDLVRRRSQQLYAQPMTSSQVLPEPEPESPPEPPITRRPPPDINQDDDEESG